jgi:hypothetical protein
MKKISFLHLFLVAVLYVSGTLCALAQDWNQILKTANPHRYMQSYAGRNNEFFGNAVAFDDNYAVVGASQMGIYASSGYKIESAGAAFVFKNNSGEWTQVKKIVPPEPFGNGKFGISVAISGQFIVVGVNNTADGKRAVYIFGRDEGGMDNWGFVKKIATPSNKYGYYFGFSVAISDNTVVVGDYAEPLDANEENEILNAGAAYIFYRNEGGVNNWGLAKKLVANDRFNASGFGFSLSLKNNLLAIGAMSEARDAGGANIMNGAGAVYLFNKDQGGAGNWGQVKKIVAADRAADDRFGVSVAISDTLLIVGAPYEKEDANGMNTLNGAGSAYLFSKNGGGADMWGQVKKIVAIDRATNDNFGYAVSMAGNIAVAGAPNADDAGGGVTDCGAVYIFDKDQDGLNYWGLAKKVTAPQRENADKFGTALSINGTTLLVSAPQENHDPNGKNPVVYAGSAFFLAQNNGGVNQWGNQQKIALKDYVAEQHYGNAVAMDGDYAVIGGMDDFSDANGQNHTKRAGAAWIFKNVNGQWTLVKKLVVPDRNAFDNFGFTVAINGPNIVVGAYLHDLDGNGANPLQDAGAAYIFNKDAGGTDNWGLVKKLVAYHRAYGTGFGSSVAISGSSLVVGAYGASEDANGSNTLTAAGAAYVFSKDLGGTNNWGLVKKITPADRKYEDLFGDAAAMEGNYMVIGASACDHYNVNSGAAYLYGKDQGGVNNWGLIKKLVAPLGAINDRLGYSVGISGTNIVIGVRGDDEDAGDINYKQNAGSAYIFSKDAGGLNNWGIVKKLTAFDRDQLDFFGHSVAISGNLMVAGAPGDNENASGTNTLSDAGSAYIYQKDLGGTNNWGFVQKIAAADRGANDQFGNATAISGNSIFVGAYLDDEYIAGKNLLPDAGSAYFFKGGCGSYTMSTGSGTVIGEQGSSNTNYYNNNCSVVASITASGSNPITGSTAASVWVETVQPAFYVLRHYEITPVINPETSTGRVMLFLYTSRIRWI